MTDQSVRVLRVSSFSSARKLELFLSSYYGLASFCILLNCVNDHRPTLAMKMVIDLWPITHPRLFVCSRRAFVLHLHRKIFRGVYTSVFTWQRTFAALLHPFGEFESRLAVSCTCQSLSAKFSRHSQRPTCSSIETLSPKFFGFGLYQHWQCLAAEKRAFSENKSQLARGRRNKLIYPWTRWRNLHVNSGVQMTKLTDMQANLAGDFYMHVAWLIREGGDSLADLYFTSRTALVLQYVFLRRIYLYIQFYLNSYNLNDRSILALMLVETQLQRIYNGGVPTRSTTRVHQLLAVTFPKWLDS